jgi:hypothetical protein
MTGEDSTIEYHGHVLGFDVSNPANPMNLMGSFCATPNPNNLPTGQEPARGGGIWMAGGAPASDGTSAYFTTGNGAWDYDPVKGTYIEAKIPAALAVLDCIDHRVGARTFANRFGVRTTLRLTPPKGLLISLRIAGLRP